MRTTGFGGSIFLIAVGAILNYAVTVEGEGFDINTIGVILMIAGAAGIVLTLAVELFHKDRHATSVKREVDSNGNERVVEEETKVS